MDNSVTVPQRLSSRDITATPRDRPHRNEGVCPLQDMDTSVHSSTGHNSQKGGKTPMSLHRWLDNQNVVRPHRMPPGEGTKSWHGPQRGCTLRGSVRKPGTKGPTAGGSSDTRCPGQPTPRDTERNGGSQGLRVTRE